MPDHNHCTGCTACASSCTKNAITMTADSEGFLEPVIDGNKCIGCHVCEDVCPLGKPVAANKPVRVFAAKSNDVELQKASSSGGLFSEAALAVLSMGGVVAGVRLDRSFHAVHAFAQALDELEPFRGSKYVQSELGNTFRQIKAFLDESRLVLFSGTPCQVAGLKSFLRKDYDNLITADIICHGVPSPLVWDEYIGDKTRGKRVRRISFRDKSYGWNNYSLMYELEDGKRAYENRAYSDYLRGFNQNLFLRKSCYDCRFKGVNRTADLTLADCWGIESLQNGFADKNGVSAVFIHSEKGQTLFESLKNTVSHELDPDAVIKMNRSMISSAPKNADREAFFDYVNAVGSKAALHKYCHITLREKVILQLKKIYRKIKSI